MKKSTINTITTILGWLIILSIIPVGFIIEQNLGIIIPSFLFSGIVLIYFKNDDAIAIAKRYFNRFKP